MSLRTAALVLSIALAAAAGGCKGRSNASSSSEAPSATAAATARPGTRPGDDPLAASLGEGPPMDWSQPVPATPAGGLAEAGYVGSEACRDCHTEIYDRYAHHSMARTGLRPLSSLDPKWLADMFDAGARQPPVRHEASGLSYRPFRRGDGYFVEELMVGDDGAKVHSSVVQLTHALGAGGYGIAFYFRRGERVYHVPIDYYPQVRRWGLDPAARRGNPRFSAAIETFCISCHSSYPLRRAATSDVFLEPLPAGVGCERCHGPGAKHVKTASASDIVDPARLPLNRQLDACAQCHESSYSELRAGRDEFSYRPGQPLVDYRINYVLDPPEPDRFQLLAHADRMVRSACFRGSGGKLVCTTCHDPHTTSFGKTAAYWDQKCESCHRDKPCTAPPADRAAHGDHCVGCHMRSGTPASPPEVTITDHWIQRRPPPVRDGEPLPAHLLAWSRLLEQPAHGDDLQTIEAMAYAGAGQDDQAARLAGFALGAGHPKVPRLYEWLARRFAGEKQPWNAARAYAEALRIDPNARGALSGYARLLLDEGSPRAGAEATHALDRMLAIDPGDPDALETKGLLLFRAARVQDARPLLERATAESPTAGAAHVGLAALALRDGRTPDAIAELEAARTAFPTDAWIGDKLGELYSKAHDVAHAADIERSRAYFRAHGGWEPTRATRWLPAEWR